MKLSRKVCTITLFSVLLTMLLTTSVFAANVAKVGNKKYSSLQEALRSAKGGQTVTLLKNADMDTDYVGMSFSGKCTLNLNKKTVVIKGGGQIDVTGGTLIIKNGTIKKTTRTGRILYVSGPKAAIQIQSGTYQGSICVREGKLTITGGTFRAISTNNVGVITAVDGGKVLIKKGTFTSSGTKMPLIENYGGRIQIDNGSFSYKYPFDGEYSDTCTPEIGNGVLLQAEGDNSVTIINGGTFKSSSLCFYLLEDTVFMANKGTFISENGGLLQCQEADAVNLKGGTYKVAEEGWGVLYSYSSPVTVTGGTYSSKWTIFENHNYDDDEKSPMVIKGGKFTTANNGDYPAMVLNMGNRKATVKITGGTFTSKGKRTYGYWNEEGAGKLTISKKSIFKGTKGENKKGLFGEE